MFKMGLKSGQARDRGNPQGPKWTGRGPPGPKASAVYADRDDGKDNILSHVG